ncbi:hypothetical protein ACFE04_004354 [Oxalis oulophora]
MEMDTQLCNSNSNSLINRIHGDFIHFATSPTLSSSSSSSRTNELDLVRGVLQILQGFSTSLFYWDESGQTFLLRHPDLYLTHLSRNTLHALLNQFLYAATCLRLVQSKLETTSPNSIPRPPPTLAAFSTTVSACLKFLFQVVHGAIPKAWFHPNLSIQPAEIALHILDYLYNKLDQVCLVQGGEEEAYQMLLYIFVGSLLPWIETLDSWLFEGILNDPSEEMFFYANKEVSVDEAEFWEKSYLFRQIRQRKLEFQFSGLTSASEYATLANDKRETADSKSGSAKGKVQSNRDLQVCPLFVKDIAKSIVSAGKSLQLIRHAPIISSRLSTHNRESEVGKQNDDSDFKNFHQGQSIAGLTLSEIFCVSLAGFIGHGDHVSRYLLLNNWRESGLISSEKIWCKFFLDSLSQKGVIDSSDKIQRSFVQENPVITLCNKKFLNNNRDSWKKLKLSRNFDLPPLNDDVLRDAVFGCGNEPFSGDRGTNYSFGFRFGESEYLRSQDDTKQLEALFPFPTMLPSFQDDLRMSELLPFQKNSTLPSKVLSWLQSVEPRATLHVVLMQECLTVYIKKQVEWVGKLILAKLMNEWRLMDELAVLRAIYLLGSGDLLQHFLSVVFSKLGKRESCDDDFELNTLLQESIRNSADGNLLSAPDTLVVSISKAHGFDGEDQTSSAPLPSTPRKNRVLSFGIDGLDSLKFTYRVSWPLELIANAEAIKKYNQVMGFLLKVKRAKYVLDKARMWMWKCKGTGTGNRKHHWLVEQKLLHFVDAFHQYVMDKVYHNAWLVLCEGMEKARSLDEVLEVHEAYLLSIQRQCFVVPDKLWALIATRINTILSLALDFYSIQQTLSSGVVVSSIKARCETELNRIDKQFDDCIAFLLRVLSFKLNVGNFPHLADLVARINYNHFYMSHTGNLTTALVSDNTNATSRRT